MTKFIVSFLAGLVLSMPSLASAQHRHGPYHHHHHYRHSYSPLLGAALLGGVVTYVVTRPDPVVVTPPTQVIVQPQADVIIDGVAYKKQWILVNGAYQEVLVRM